MPTVPNAHLIDNLTVFQPMNGNCGTRSKAIFEKSFLFCTIFIKNFKRLLVATTFPFLLATHLPAFLLEKIIR